MIRVEFIRQLRRARTWGHIAAISIVPILVGIANYTQGRGRHRQELNLYFLGTNNAVNFGIFLLLIMKDFFIVVVIASLAGESVSGEASWGTLRYLLIRPVSRVRLILSKLFVSAVLAFAVTLLVSVIALVVGTAFFGLHDVYLIGEQGSFSIVSVSEGLSRFALGAGYVAMCTMFVVAVGIFLSTLTDSTAGAVVGTIVVVVTCGVLLAVPSLEGIKPVVPTNYWGQYNGIFNPTITTDLWKGLVSSAVWSTAFSIAALLRFQRKDILS
ncbi:MAG: type transport system permease protein [Acidimicrobiaceae bacterium]|jgi:ABC-2 type transport system permease protein